MYVVKLCVHTATVYSNFRTHEYTSHRDFTVVFMEWISSQVLLKAMRQINHTWRFAVDLRLSKSSGEKETEDNGRNCHLDAEARTD